VKFSVTLGAAGEGRDPAALAALARLAEESGWDAVFLEDYVDYQGTGLPTYDTWVCLAAIAAATTRIRLGPTVTPVPRRRPWELAAQAVAVDHLSAGRLILGVGAGDISDAGFRATGDPVDPRTLAQRLDEGLELIVALWSGAEVHRYRLDGLRLAATPVQSPRIPIWIGGNLNRPGVRRRLAQWDGACVFADQPLTPADIREIRALAPCTGFDIKASGSPELIPEFAAAGATWWGRWIAPADFATTRAVIAAGPPARPDRLQLRPATSADSDLSFRLHRATMRDYVGQIWGWDDDVQQAMHDQRFDPPTTRIITVDGVDAGIIVTEQRPTELYLSRIAVDPGYQGQGIGRQVIEGLLVEAGEQGKTVVLEVLTSNPRAEALYRRLGFHEESRHGPDNIKIQMRAQRVR
jgi:ribosomal protein S18 acetylase RimI-like enzyme